MLRGLRAPLIVFMGVRTHGLVLMGQNSKKKKLENLKEILHVQYSTAQHSTAQHSTAQHSTAQHSTAQHSTAQHSTVQYSIVCTMSIFYASLRSA
jgi:hypothetical protein